MKTKNIKSLYKKPWFIIISIIVFIPIFFVSWVYIENAITFRKIDKLIENSQEKSESTKKILAETEEYITSQKALLANLKPKLELQGWNSKMDYGYVIVEGRVKNITNDSLRNVEALVEFYTEGGMFISSESALIEYQTLLPQQISPFKIMGDINPLMKKSKISFKELFGDQIFHKEKGE